jgi:tartrate-resistant acid phosphatase type 5
MHTYSKFFMLALGMAALASGCGSEPQNATGTTDGGASTHSNAGGAGAGDPTGTTGTGGSGAGSSGTGGATSTSTGTGGGSGEVTLRFVALGDGGEGNPTQYKVGEAAKAVCDAKGGCDFALYLGDNFYDSGVSGTRDSQFQSKFEMPYAILPFRFYVVLGNHDYGGNGTGFEFWKAEAQVEYTQISSKWTMPAPYYKFATPGDAGPASGPVATFFGLDTNAIMYTGDGDQQAWLEGEMAAAAAGWKIGYGHHPYVSNGAHGNAGEYEGIPGIPIVSGGNVKDFFDASVCGKVDVYLSGHDHNRQWLQPTCGTEFIVSGTAAKTTDLEGQGTPTFFETDQKGGLLLVELTASTFKGTFYDEDGLEEFSRTVTK